MKSQNLLDVSISLKFLFNIKNLSYVANI